MKSTLPDFSPQIACVIESEGRIVSDETIIALQHPTLVSDIFVAGGPDASLSESLDVGESVFSTATLQEIARRVKTPYVLFYLKNGVPEWFPYGLERMLRVAEDTGADWVYSDYHEVRGKESFRHPVLEYQPGSVRDDFHFGPLILVSTAALQDIAPRLPSYHYAGFYAFRLALSRKSSLVRINEWLYTDHTINWCPSGEKQFDYLRSDRRSIQMEMEQAFTVWLQEEGAILTSEPQQVDFQKEGFPVEASVVIPVLNRIHTLKDALDSALLQQTNFSFNILVVDNYSTDGTTNLIAEYARQYPQIVHLIPDRKGLGIGGCWNEAIFSTHCGKFAIQLDSDDLYAGPDTLQTLVDVFYRDRAAVVVGSYRMVDFSLNEIPPGIIDHREWTPENGRNNALRIHGLGAPRAFYAPLLRQVRFPDVSYGEDYAVMLSLSRRWKISRIYEPVYLCRRWDRNTDARLDITRENSFHFYKDKIRTIELECRKRIHQMICGVLVLWLVFSPERLFGQVKYTPEDSMRVSRVIEYAQKEKLKEKTSGLAMLSIASCFLDTPYEAGTLENPEREWLTIHLGGLDCTTLVENSLALFHTIRGEKPSFKLFISFLEKVRYRDGENHGYLSRFHYTSDFLTSHASAGWMEDIAASLGGLPYPLDLSFMSSHASLYPALENRKERIDSLRILEKNISRRVVYYLPKSMVRKASADLRDGDLVALATSVGGLDVSHIGLASSRDGEMFFMHASSAQGKVEITEVPLWMYLGEIRSNTGILIFRLK